MVLELHFESAQLSLNSLDLDERGVGKLAEKSKAFVDGLDGGVVFSDSGFKALVLPLPGESLFVKGLSVCFDVGLQLSKSIGDSISLGEENVVNEIVAVEDVSVGILNLLGES